MSLKRFTTLSTVWLFSLLVFACAPAAPSVPAFRREPAAENEVAVRVYSEGTLTEINVPFERYSSWTELIAGEFDGRSPERAEAVMRGDYVVAIGLLRPMSADGIVIYLNAEYSPFFLRNCPYFPASVLSFVPPSFGI